MFIFKLVNFRIVKPQLVGKTVRIKVNFSNRQIAGKTI